LRDLVTVVPFGVSDASPRQTRPVLRGVVPGIGPGDKIVLWGGGVYNWFDPLTLLHAVDKLRSRVPSVRLFFLGLKHPNPHVPEMRMAVATRELANELGLTDTHVFFNEGWVDYDDRQNYLLESDVGVSTHLDHIETEFSFRTRILDYIWASLPVVATGGDSLAEIIERHGVGRTVPAEDVDALEEALFELLADDGANRACRENMQVVAEEFRWSRVLQPLAAFCRAPRRAPDLLDGSMSAIMRDGEIRRRAPRPSWWRSDLRVFREHYRSGGMGTVVRNMCRRIRRTLSGSRPGSR